MTKTFVECPYCFNRMPMFENIIVKKCGNCGSELPEVRFTYTDKNLARNE